MVNLSFSTSSSCGEGFFQKTLRFSIYVVVISTLRAFMEDEVCHLNDIPVPWIPFEVRPSWSLTSSSPDRFNASETSLWFRLLSSSNFSICSISPRDFFSFARQFLQRGVYRLIVFHWSQSCQEKFRLVISAITSNCFHAFGIKTFLFKTQQHTS